MIKLRSTVAKNSKYFLSIRACKDLRNYWFAILMKTFKLGKTTGKLHGKILVKIGKKIYRSFIINTKLFPVPGF